MDEASKDDGGLPEFTVVRGHWHSDSPPDLDTVVVVKVNGIWMPPGDECWYFASDDEMRNGDHRLVDIEIVASPR